MKTIFLARQFRGSFGGVFWFVQVCVKKLSGFMKFCESDSDEAHQLRRSHDFCISDKSMNQHKKSIKFESESVNCIKMSRSRCCPVISLHEHIRASNDSCTSRVQLTPRFQTSHKIPFGTNKTRSCLLLIIELVVAKGSRAARFDCASKFERLFTTSSAFLHTRRRRFMNEVHLARSRTRLSGVVNLTGSFLELGIHKNIWRGVVRKCSRKWNRWAWKKGSTSVSRPWHRKRESRHCDGAQWRSAKHRRILVWCINISSDSSSLFRVRNFPVLACWPWLMRFMRIFFLSCDKRQTFYFLKTFSKFVSMNHNGEVDLKAPTMQIISFNKPGNIFYWCQVSHCLWLNII